MKKKVAVALSGGLDSAVAASLLKENDFHVIGLYFSTGHECLPGEPTPSREKPSYRAGEIASSLDIDLEVIDCAAAFSREVITYFLETYKAGKTPNPCVVCNHRIKFGVVWDYARAVGAEGLATGHYARITGTAETGFRLMKGIDPVKDQSYFLHRLTQDQLTRAVFPLGVLTKKRVKEIAAARGLATATGHESQELCFINDAGYREFLAAHGVEAAGPGPIVNTAGEVLGQHQGLHRHTIGQRRGMGIPGPEPYYVLRLDRERNRLVIGTKDELSADALTVTDINWIGMAPPEEPFRAGTRIRYRHKEAPSLITPIDPGKAKVVFETPQDAITPGQAAVFYDGDRVLGGGWIDRIGEAGPP